MIIHTEAIILHTQRFGEKALIVKALAPAIGLQSYLVPHAFAKGQVKQVGYYFTGSILELTTYHRSTRELQKITSAQLSYSPKTLLTNPIKNCYLQLLVELISQIIPAEEPNESMYQYCRAIILALDNQNSQLFIWLLNAIARLCPILGFMPNFERTTVQNPALVWSFDYQAGQFFKTSATQDLRGHYLYEVFTQKHTSANENFTIIPLAERLSTLELLIQYLSYHLGKPISLRTLDVMQAVFSN